MPAETPPHRLLLLSVLAALLGLAGGVAAYALLHLIGLLTNLALFHRFGWTVPSFRDLPRNFGLILAAVGGGFVVSLLAVWSPVIRGHGIPEAMEAVLTKQSRISPRAALAKPLSAAIAIGTGGPFGAEGPIIVTGGALGSLIGQVVHVSPSERKILLACGAAAGMAATFGTPLAAVILAIELLLFEFSVRAFIPLVVASSIAAGAHVTALGSGPLFAVPAHSYAGLGKLPLYVALGALCGLVAVLVTKGLHMVEALYRRLPVREFFHPLIGAAGFAIVGLIVPRALGVGYDVLGDVLAGRIAVGALAALVVAKMIAWWVALGSGTSGGTMAPVLLIGGGAGSLIGSAIAHIAPGLHVSPGAFALVAMAAVFGASARATFASMVFVFEVTRDYQIILPLMLATVVADLVASSLMHESLMTEKLSRRGLRVHAEYEVDVFRTTRVGDVMTTAVKTVPADATIGDARATFDGDLHNAYPIVDGDGRCSGIVARDDLIRDGSRAEDPVLSIANEDIVSVSPDHSLLETLNLMLQEEVDHVPVIDDSEQLVGICTRTDVLRARGKQLEQDQRQRGWRPPPRMKKREDP
jgi:CIC family chloride channel protein